MNRWILIKDTRAPTYPYEKEIAVCQHSQKLA